MTLTEHFDLEEFTESPTAKKLGIENNPSDEEIARLMNLCREVLEPLRVSLGKPIRVDSGFRCTKLNEAVGGVPNSQHSRGEAADIRVRGLTPGQVMRHLTSLNIDFDEAIDEEDVNEGSKWLHVSYTTRRKNRRLRKRAIREDGTTTYFPA